MQKKGKNMQAGQKDREHSKLLRLKSVLKFGIEPSR